MDPRPIAEADPAVTVSHARADQTAVATSESDGVGGNSDVGGSAASLHFGIDLTPKSMSAVLREPQLQLVVQTNLVRVASLDMLKMLSWRDKPLFIR